MEALRELDATTERLRLERLEWFPNDVQDPRDRDAFELDERQEQRRREFRGANVGPAADR